MSEGCAIGSSEWRNALFKDVKGEGWNKMLRALWSNYGERIERFLKEDHERYSEAFDIYPKVDDIFRAFKECSLEDMRVVIIGQDCYINPGEAHGLAFSVKSGGATGGAVKMPPSLRNIFKEIQAEYGGERRENMDLTDWARQGVLLLNTALTVRQSCSGSHVYIWKDFTTELMLRLGRSCKGSVFMLWGNHAQEYEKYIDGVNNLILKHSHPSPLSRKPFVGNNHFKRCNEYLVDRGKNEIFWV